MSNAITNKINHIFQLLTLLSEGKELYPQDISLQNKFNVSERTLRRYLEDIHHLFGHIVLTYKTKTVYGQRKTDLYRVVNRNKDISKVWKFFIENGDDFTWLIQLVLENNCSILKNLSVNEQTTIESVLEEEKDVIQFVTQPFESFHDINFKKHFINLKRAVLGCEYRDIEYILDAGEILHNVKCLKILHISNNWYLATELDNGSFRLLRITFIEKISYATNSSYQKRVKEKYIHYFENIQNAFSIFEGSQKRAILEISPERSKYFLPDMKPFFKSQKFLGYQPNGKVQISILFTQPLEILPFIKQWLPHIKILEPKSLIEEFTNELIKSFEQHGIQVKPSNYDIPG